MSSRVVDLPHSLFFPVAGEMQPPLGPMATTESR